MRVLVTGGAGYIGRHLVSRIVADKHQVYVADARTYAATGWDEVSSIAYQCWESDVTSPEYVNRAIGRSDPEIVYHLAAESHVDRSLLEPSKSMLVNGVGTSNVAMACAAKSIPMVYCSTDEVYGDLCDTVYEHEGAVESQTPLRPSSPYSAGKAAGDFAVEAAARSFGLIASITRGCNAFGPGQYPEKLVPIACRLISRGEPVPLHGGGQQVRQWIHVEDFVEGLLLAGRDAIFRSGRPGSARVAHYNLAGPARVTVRALVEALATAAGVDPKTSWVSVGDRPGQDRLYALSDRHSKRALGFRANRDILSSIELKALLAAYGAEGLLRIAEWEQTG